MRTPVPYVSIPNSGNDRQPGTPDTRACRSGDAGRVGSAQVWLIASSLAGSPAMRVCHMRRGWVMS